jgi:hypothetical protein
MQARRLYLDLMKQALTDSLYDNVDPRVREEGRDWPSRAYTMIGLKRLANLEHCITQVLEQAIVGDLMETGVWRGGATIFMRAVLQAYGVSDRLVWVADSFQGLPPSDAERYPADAGYQLELCRELAVSLAEVKANFRKFNLLDEQVRFLKGWFRDTLADAPVEKLAVLRLDGDLYESTILALTHLYPKLSLGGYLIVDDYGAVAACRKAVDDYRAAQAITEEVKWVDWTGVYWQRRA